MFDLSKFQDDIGQLTRLKTYTHLLVCFPLSDSTPKGVIIDALHEAAGKVVSAFPWLAAKVVHEGQAPGNSGVFRLGHCSEFAPPNSIVVVKSCSDVSPSYDEIYAARGPCSMFNGQALGPVIAFPESYEESDTRPARVFVIQANFIKGGLLLDAAAHHNFIDGGGLFQCVQLFAKALRGEPFSDLELEQGNRDRRTLIPLLDPHEPLLDHSHLRCPPASATPSSRPARAPAAWHFWRVPSASVARIKDQANLDLRVEASKTPFVSTNDALSAFLWKRVADVRLRRRGNPDELTKLSRAMDVRRAMGIPPEYMGQMGYNATTRVSFGELTELSLGSTAAVLRNKVKEVNTPYSVRSWATFIAREQDKSTIMFGGTFNPDTDVGVSSLAHVELYSRSFGPLGNPGLVRRPNFRPLEGCVYFWSRTKEGDIDVLTCLNEADIEGLKMDKEWRVNTEYIG
ncbi:transferase family-domain-containing protein [Aspergillus avenaceus]|uniref:Transferase family-domain-containing protein n=1 Tax=Aspergillus avenaceus TaxID=36643 RepID=A0A5N6TQ87_ASPAV|nr:transferase family-domain-containing protein [Aspergillus avenaceus]